MLLYYNPFPVYKGPIGKPVEINLCFFLKKKLFYSREVKKLLTTDVVWNKAVY